MDLEKFCGRKAILELLARRVLDLKEGYRQNVAILGYPYVGKTAVLHKFLAEIEAPDVVRVYLNLENQDFGYFYHKVVASLLHHFAKSRQLPLHEEIPFLVETVRDHLPQTIKVVRRIQALVAQHKRSDAYREIVSLPQIFAQEANMFCVFVLDEFHELENLAVTDVFKILGAKIMTQKRCLYVVTSSNPSVAEGILSEKMSLLFGNFEKLILEPLDIKTSQDFIRMQLPRLKLGEPLQYFLIDFSGGQPLALELFCEEINRLAILHSQEEVFLPLLSQAVENVLFHPWGVLSRHFDLLLHALNPAKSNVPILSLLQSLAGGRKKIKELAGECGLKQTTVTQRMTRLLELGIVMKNGNFYYLKDKVFRYWLKFVFRQRQKAIALDDQGSREMFRADLQQAFDMFVASARKDFPDRIMDLFTCFEKEVLHLNGRRYELPMFEEVRPSETKRSAFSPAPWIPDLRGGVKENKTDRVIPPVQTDKAIQPVQPQPPQGIDFIQAVTGEGEWLVALKRNVVSENDINTIVDYAQQRGLKPQRCILISFHDLDENARVRALQERMWIWSEGELRTLLNLFDKPYIIPQAF